MGSLSWPEILIIAAIPLAIYPLPTIIAFVRNHHQRGPITVVNLLLGWTFLGWVVAFAWSFSAVRHASTSPTQDLATWPK